MTRAARSVVYFGVYIFLIGLVLLLAPNVLLSIFGMASTTEVWIRVLGCVVTALGAYYIVLGKASQYLAAWIIARSEGEEAARAALHYVAPVGEKEEYVSRAMKNIGPYLPPQ